MRVVFPAALSGIVASIVLGVSRAVGETMIVLIAAGQVAAIGASTRVEPMETMTAFIAATAKGDIATGSIAYKTIFAVGTHAVRDHADHEHDLDPLRAQVQAGLRVSARTAQAIAHTAHGRAAAPRTAASALGAARLPRALDRCCWACCSSTSSPTAPAVSRWDFITSFSSISADQAGIQAALWGTIWLMGVCALFIVPVGVATAIYLEEYADETKWCNRLIEVNIQNLAAVPSIVYGILGLAFLVRGPLSLGPRRCSPAASRSACWCCRW